MFDRTWGGLFLGSREARDGETRQGRPEASSPARIVGRAPTARSFAGSSPECFGVRHPGHSGPPGR